MSISLSIQLRRRGIESKLILSDTLTADTQIDSNLIRLLAKAHHHLEQLTSGQYFSIADLAIATQSNADEISRVLPLAFLAPAIVRTILEGKQPIELTAKHLSRLDHLPFDWKDQQARLGFG